MEGPSQCCRFFPLYAQVPRPSLPILVYHPSLHPVPCANCSAPGAQPRSSRICGYLDAFHMPRLSNPTPLEEVVQDPCHAFGGSLPQYDTVREQSFIRQMAEGWGV